ncbi:MAG: copper-binding protein [Rhodocyclaceae bacterium]|nr:copper-binding protein [Rhodocyclaceae bacterium]
MNKTIVAGGLGLFLSTTVLANTSTRELPPEQFRGTMMVMTRGTVVTVDKTTKKLSISHQGNQDLEIPAATTKFGVASADMLTVYDAGATVFFVADRVGNEPVVVRLEPRRPSTFKY